MGDTAAFRHRGWAWHFQSHVPRRHSRPSWLSPSTRLDGRSVASHRALGGSAGPAKILPPFLYIMHIACRAEPRHFFRPVQPLPDPPRPSQTLLDVLPSPSQPEVEAMVPCETCRRRRAQHVPYVVGLQAERAKMHRGPMAAAEAAKLLRRRSQAAVWVGCAGKPRTPSSRRRWLSNGAG